MTDQSANEHKHASLDEMIAAMMEIASIQADLIRDLHMASKIASRSNESPEITRSLFDERRRVARLSELRTRSQEVLRWLLARQSAEP